MTKIILNSQKIPSQSDWLRNSTLLDRLTGSLAENPF